jgi:hemerythrin superfamily protein
MDIFEKLEGQHEQVREAFQEFGRLTFDDKENRKRLFKDIKSQLMLHTQIEEDAVYPVLGQFKELKGLIDESYEEHQMVENQLNELDRWMDSFEDWQSKMLQLEHAVMHHVSDEEDKVFPQARQLLSQQQMQDMLNDAEQVLQKNWTQLQQ